MTQLHIKRLHYYECVHQASGEFSPWVLAHQRGRYFRDRPDPIEWIPVYAWVIPQLATSWHVLAAPDGAGVGRWWPVTGGGTKHWFTLLNCAASVWGERRIAKRQHGGQRCVLGSDCVAFARLVEFSGGAKPGETWVPIGDGRRATPEACDNAVADQEVWSRELAEIGWQVVVRHGLKAADIERRVAAEGVAV